MINKNIYISKFRFGVPSFVKIPRRLQSDIYPLYPRLYYLAIQDTSCVYFSIFPTQDEW